MATSATPGTPPARYPLAAVGYLFVQRPTILDEEPEARSSSPSAWSAGCATSVSRSLAPGTQRLALPQSPGSHHRLTLAADRWLPGSGNHAGLGRIDAPISVNCRAQAWQAASRHGRLGRDHAQRTDFRASTESSAG